MEVTRNNLESVKSLIEEQLAKADFICMDGEFSGLRTGRDQNAFNTPSECYSQIRETYADFLLFQLGVSFFHRTPGSSAYKHSVFNFYIFPRQTIKNAPDKIFLCQSSAIDFLATNKFDFNKLFYEGINYLTPAEELQLREEIEEKHAVENSQLNSSNSDLNESKDAPIAIPPELQPQIDDVTEQVQKLVDSGSKEKLQFEDLNSFVRKLLYQELKLKFESKIFMESVPVENKRKSILVISLTENENDLLLKMKQKHDKEWNDLELAIGFSSVMKLISSSGKLIIGHCMILDVIHVLDQFFAPLPQKYDEFKEFASSTFPRILDTMYMLSLSPFKEKTSVLNLTSLMTFLSQQPFVLPQLVVEEGCQGYSISEDKYHNAGYDSFITGVCFIAMCEYLKTLNPSFYQEHLNSESILLKPYLNKLFLFKTSFQDSPYINLSGNDANPARDHVFYMKFPKTWKLKDIFQLFKPYGGVTVGYINDTSAYVGMRFRDKTSQAFRALGNKNPTYTLIPYKAYHLSLKKNENGSTVQEKQTLYHKTHWTKDEKKQALKRELNSPPRNRVWKRKTSESDSAAVGAQQSSEFARALDNSASSSNDDSNKRKRRTSSGTFVVSDEQIPKSTFQEDDNWE